MLHNRKSLSFFLPFYSSTKHTIKPYRLFLSGFVLHCNLNPFHIMFSSVSNNSIIILRHCTFLLPPRLSLIFPSLRSFALPAPMDNSHTSNPNTSYARATPSSDSGRGRAFDMRNDRARPKGHGGGSGSGKDKIDALGRLL